MDWPTALTLWVGILTAGYCYGFRLWLEHTDPPTERTEAIGFLAGRSDDDET